MTLVHAEPLDLLRLRTSEKWVTYPADVLPLFVAEMDYPIAPVVAEAVIARVRASDSGYVSTPGPLAPAFAAFAAERWGWTVDPAQLRSTTDVSLGIVEVLRVLLQPGSPVVITPPVYPPYFGLIPEAGHTLVEVPLRGSELDLAGIEAAFASGARAILLCNPHNPLGHPHPTSSLAALAEIAERYGAVVVSDEIFAPLVHTDAEFTPFLAASEAAGRVGVCVTSASKGWNLAGFKCAVIVTADAALAARLDAMSEEVTWRTSILGLHASVAAFTQGVDYLDGTIAAIEASRGLLGELLAEHLPAVGYREPHAGYLAWLDFRALGWSEDPAARILREARVALVPGPEFGAQGQGFARLNLACSPEVLTEAIERLARVA
ncbi:aminotransferase class I/II-fold pyridoxal phosphate-dependent enzyme [Microbacteriaceae bacterium VKM Ac-2854]|nr:aminotransferase class I/II-fold pyridoxal phosphate-dependent enzyme [Microbacteriaceae bacterium VKM Ac-2854]